MSKNNNFFFQEKHKQSILPRPAVQAVGDTVHACLIVVGAHWTRVGGGNGGAGPTVIALWARKRLTGVEWTVVTLRAGKARCAASRVGVLTSRTVNRCRGPSGTIIPWRYSARCFVR